MINLNVSLIGANLITTHIEGMMARIVDLSPAFESIRNSFWGMEEEQFSTEGGFSGGWAQLSHNYAEWKQSVAPGMPILQLSGALMRSLTGQANGTIAEIHPAEARLGTSIPYGMDHQTGKDRLPARPPIEVPEEYVQQWTSMIETYIMGTGVA